MIFCSFDKLHHRSIFSLYDKTIGFKYFWYVFYRKKACRWNLHKKKVEIVAIGRVYMRPLII